MKKMHRRGKRETQLGANEWETNQLESFNKLVENLFKLNLQGQQENQRMTEVNKNMKQNHTQMTKANQQSMIDHDAVILQSEYENFKEI